MIQPFLKTAYLGLLFSCFSLPILRAQNQVSGTLLDASGGPIIAANVLLLNATDSSLVRGSLSADDGAYLFENITDGSFLVRTMMLGYDAAYSQQFELGTKTSQILDPIRMTESASMLNEVSVVAKRPFLEQKIDRTVVNVANTITNAGGTAYDVLQRSPGVQINKQSNSISLLGKQGVTIMINGKISRLPADAIVQMLAGMNADNIDRIELIHTPPSDFDAEGNGGVINIILKSTGDDGFNGGYSAKAGYGRGEKYGAGVYFNSRKNKLNWFGSYDYNLNNNPQVFTNYRGVYQGNDFLETSTFSDRYRTPYATNSLRLGADYQVSKKTVIGVLGTFFDGNWDMDATNHTRYTKNGHLDSLIEMPNTEINHNRTYTGNLNLTQQIGKNQTLNIDLDYVNNDISNPSYYDVQNQDAEGTLTHRSELNISKKTPVNVAVGKADYTITFGKNSKLETGAKLTSMRFDNDVRVESRVQPADWIVIPELTSLFHLKESVAAGYASFSTKLDAKTDLKAGLRYEYTNTNLGSAEQPNLVDRQYGSWFPTAYITRKLTEKQSLNLSYSRRITRPQIRQLAPWLIFIDPSTLQGGNTAIQPSFTDALGLDYGLKSWHFGLSYSIEHSPMRYVPSVDTLRNVQIGRDENLDKEQVISANLSFPVHPTKWWEMSNNVFVNSTTIDFALEGQAFQVQNVNYGFNSNNTFRLPKKFSLEISGRYNAPGYWGITYWKATGSLDIGLEKNLGAWGKLRFNAVNLFESDNWKGTTEQPDINLYTKASFEFAERTFMLSWTNTFGNTKLKAARDRQTGAAEEMKRL